MACPGRKQCIKFEIRTACRELRFSCQMYELCAQDDELWTSSAVQVSFADDQIQYAIWNYCGKICAGSNFAATMWDFKSNGSPTLSVILFLLPWKSSMEVGGSSWKWHGSWWKRRGSAMEARGNRMEAKIGFMEADGTSWNQNPTSMEALMEVLS